MEKREGEDFIRKGYVRTLGSSICARGSTEGFKGARHDETYILKDALTVV